MNETTTTTTTRPAPAGARLFYGIFGSASVPVLARSAAEAAERLRLAGFGVADRVQESRR